jgi:hypothetical protein
MARWPVEDAFTKSFAPAAMVIVDPRWREVGSIYWGRLLVICWNIFPNSQKNSIDDYQYHSTEDEVLTFSKRNRPPLPSKPTN